MSITLPEPQEKYYRVKLPIAEVDGYHEFIGLDKERWLKLPQCQRVSVAWADMLAKLKARTRNN